MWLPGSGGRAQAPGLPGPRSSARAGAPCRISARSSRRGTCTLNQLSDRVCGVVGGGALVGIEGQVQGTGQFAGSVGQLLRRWEVTHLMDALPPTQVVNRYSNLSMDAKLDDASRGMGVAQGGEPDTWVPPWFRAWVPGIPPLRVLGLWAQTPGFPPGCGPGGLQ